MLAVSASATARALASTAIAQNSQPPSQAPSDSQTANRPKTLDNSGDPTLALTGPLRGSGPAPAGSARSRSKTGCRG